MNISSISLFIIFFGPLFGSCCAGLLLLRKRALYSQIISSSCIGLACISSIIVCYNALKFGTIYNINLYQWIALEGFTSFITITVNSITAVMLCVVTLVSFVVHIYSIGYMAEDEHKQRFFAYLSLFTFFMIVLITARDFVQLFLGWEGVGLSSYLLIGFWFKKESANMASIKAFVTNRVSDVFMVTGICLIYMTFKTLNFDEIISQISTGISTSYFVGQEIVVYGYSFDALTLIGMMLFLGAMGKSAQLFFHVWLPDAMEGPTPVSALIHAATMVTAGVFLMVKCGIFIEQSLFLQKFITIIGATTAIFAALVALVQTDIKKIIAYSTCSQLGYMFFAIGVLVPTAGMFHLVTHAFFKALLFLGAGSVIHACHHEQNIFQMGGLYKKIPFTFAMFMIGSVAIAGIYPLSGYFSKDAILEGAYISHTSHGNYAFVLGLISAFLTSFYSWRLIVLVFHGKYRGHAHPHESPLVMLVPLIILAILAIFIGFIANYFHILDSHFWHNAILVSGERIESMHHIVWYIKYLPTILSITAISLAYGLYLKGEKILNILEHLLQPIRYTLQKKFFFDELYLYILVKPINQISKFTIQIVEKVIDAIVPHGLVLVSKLCGNVVGKLQSGIVFVYFFTSFIFILLIFEYYSFIEQSGIIYHITIWMRSLLS